MEYASRIIFLGVAGKKARQGARVSGYDCALSVFYETQHTPLLSVKCCRVSTVTRYNKARFPYEWSHAPRRGPGQGVERICTGCLESPGRRGDEETVASAATLSGDFFPTPSVMLGTRGGLANAVRKGPFYCGPKLCRCCECGFRREVSTRRTWLLWVSGGSLCSSRGDDFLMVFVRIYDF